nr:peptidase S10, serine carboxypeptidase, alpha/beta hydrolase fold protein [Tanacetum cinerariifolium]
IDCREESETEEESGKSEEESSNKDNSEDKMYINEKKNRTRNPPKSLANIMSKLKNAQIKSLKDMGFWSFVGYKINRFLIALARWLLLNYDPRTSVLQAGDVKIKITSQTVHDIFGLPIGGKEIVELNQAKKTDEVIEEWRKEMIASKKNIIAPDTDIETHETNVAKTTLEKERMTKSKIIAAKNVVSQSLIKAVNLGDIYGKSS